MGLISSTLQGRWRSSQPETFRPVHEQTTLLKLSSTLQSQHRLYPRLTADSTTVLLLHPDTSDSPTVYKYSATQLQFRPAQSIKTCSGTFWLAVVKQELLDSWVYTFETRFVFNSMNCIPIRSTLRPFTDTWPHSYNFDLPRASKLVPGPFDSLSSSKNYLTAESTLSTHVLYSTAWTFDTAAIVYCVEKRKISYFGSARNLIQHWISPNQDDLSYSARTFISASKTGERPKPVSSAWDGDQNRRASGRPCLAMLFS